MLSDDEMYARMNNGWRGGQPDGTICGLGSTISNTRIIVGWLPKLCEQYNIKSVCDAGAGDLHWIRCVKWDVDYKPFDLIPRSSEIKKFDISKRQLPNCDAILCRMVLNHLCEDRIAMVINLFRQSATYLIATHFVGDKANQTRPFTQLDLCSYFGEPLEVSRDGHEQGCRLALWRL